MLSRKAQVTDLLARRKSAIQEKYFVAKANTKNDRQDTNQLNENENEDIKAPKQRKIFHHGYVDIHISTKN
jgi:hypothetical protein